MSASRYDCCWLLPEKLKIHVSWAALQIETTGERYKSYINNKMLAHEMITTDNEKKWTNNIMQCMLTHITNVQQNWLIHTTCSHCTKQTIATFSSSTSTKSNTSCDSSKWTRARWFRCWQLRIAVEQKYHADQFWSSMRLRNVLAASLTPWNSALSFWKFKTQEKRWMTVKHTVWKNRDETFGTDLDVKMANL